MLLSGKTLPPSVNPFGNEEFVLFDPDAYFLVRSKTHIPGDGRIELRIAAEEVL